jgi:hypothetical protein
MTLTAIETRPSALSRRTKVAGASGSLLYVLVLLAS